VPQQLELLKVSMNLDQFDMKKQNKTEVLLAIAPLLRKKWIQPLRQALSNLPTSRLMMM
jgi:hypothetical protein